MIFGPINPAEPLPRDVTGVVFGKTPVATANTRMVKFPFVRLCVGDSFTVWQFDPIFEAPQVRSAAYRAQRRYPGTKFIVRQLWCPEKREEYLRVWRIA